MIFWEGWLSLGSTESNKWRRRLFRIRDTKLEYLDGGEDGETSSAASSFASSLSFLKASASNSSNTPSTSSTSPTPKQQGSAQDLTRSSSTSSDKDRDVAKEVGQAPQASLDIVEDIAGLAVLGGQEESVPWLRQMMQASSAKHVPFHMGMTKLLFIGKPGKGMFRVSAEGTSRTDIKRFLLSIERAVPRAHVLLAGWISTPGTINWNRRYALVLSTGHLLIFKDPSLENIRRVISLEDEESSVQPLRPLWKPGSAEEVSVLDILSKSHTSNKSYVEAVTIRVTHPSIADRKGYLMSVERMNEQESPLAHSQRFLDWVRILFALTTAGRPRSAPAQMFHSSWEALRYAEESHRALQEVINLEAFSPTPSLKALAKVGFPKKLRPALWAGIAGRRVKRVFADKPSSKNSNVKNASQHGQFALHQTPRSPFFPYPLVESKWEHQDEQQQLDASSSSKQAQVDQGIKILLQSNPTVPVSLDLRLAASLVAQTTKSVQATGEILRCIFGDAFLQYTVNSTLLAKTTLGIPPCLPTSSFHRARFPSTLTGNDQVGGKEIAQGEGEKESHDKSKEEEESLPYSFPLLVDTQVIIEILTSLFPSLPVSFLTASRDTLAHWLLSVFTYRVPFSETCSQRLWDWLLTQLDIDEEMGPSNLSIRIVISIFSLLHNGLVQAKTQDEWDTILEAPLAASSVDSETYIADDLVFRASSHRKLFRNRCAWTALKDHRAQLWNTVELEARERVVLVNQWTAVTLSLLDLTRSVLDVMNRLNRLPSSSEKQCVLTYLYPVHGQVVSFAASLAALQEALELVKSSFLLMTSKSNTMPTINVLDHDRLLDQLAQCSNITVHAGGQVSVHPSLVVRVLKGLVALSWELLACAVKSLASSDAHALDETFFCARTLLKTPSSLPRGGNVGGDNIGSGTAESLPSGGMTKFQAASTPTRSPKKPPKPGVPFQTPPQSSSFCALAKLLRPPGGGAKVMENSVGQQIHDEFLKLMQTLVLNLEEISQCIVATCVEMQRRNTDESFVTVLLIKDLFGGEAAKLSPFVPLIMTVLEEVSAAMSSLTSKELTKTQCPTLEALQEMDT